jgi:hypothetical protein
VAGVARGIKFDAKLLTCTFILRERHLHFHAVILFMPGH